MSFETSPREIEKNCEELEADKRNAEGLKETLQIEGVLALEDVGEKSKNRADYWADKTSSNPELQKKIEELRAGYEQLARDVETTITRKVLADYPVIIRRAARKYISLPAGSPAAASML